MKLFRVTLSSIVACTVLCACPNIEEGHRHIVFINNSEQMIGFQLHFLSENITCEDTLFQCNKLVFGIYPDTLRRLSAGRHADWEREMYEYSYLQILVIDEIYDSYITAPCDTIRKYVPILRRYQLTLEDLERMNWTVVYPPEE